MDEDRLPNRMILFELILIALGALFFCWKSLIFDRSMYLGGGEYILLTQTHFIWELLPQCGTCVFWNGLMNGGAPAFAEVHNAPLHPFVALPAILLGSVNGSKITLLLSFFAAGFAGWRLARASGVGSIVRMWTAYALMFGGELSGKMENGNIGLVLSAACAILLFSEYYEFAFKPREIRRIPRMGIFIALCIFAGQGYMQIAAFGILFPIAGFFAYRNYGRQILVDLLEALGIALLLSGILLLPLLHFLPNFVKDGDLTLGELQPMGYSLLNLVIKDPEFYRAGLLGQAATPYAYLIYIGWIPVILAMIGIYTYISKPDRRPQIMMLLFSFLGIFFFQQ